MELDIAGDPIGDPHLGDHSVLSVKLEPGSPDLQSPLINGNGNKSLMDYGGDSLINGHGDYDHSLLSESCNQNLSEYNSDSDSSLQRTSYNCDHNDTSELHCASSPESEDNKLDSSTVEFSLCTSSTLPTDLENGEVPKRICLVCGDIASGYHYGVASCEACKAFFKRTIQGNIEYSCPASGNCEITKRRRKACQACRFQKCLRMGMLKEGVRLDRVRGGRQKYKRSMDSPISVVPSTPIKKACIESNKMLSALLMIEPEKVYAMPDPSLPVDEYKLLSTLTDLVDRELVATIGWAKQVPGFINLSLPDQMNLLQCTWLDVLNLNLAYRSSPYKGILAFADDFHLSEEDADNYQAPVEVDTLQRKLAKKLTRVKITREEYALLKGIILFNPDAPLENPEAVRQLQEKMEDALLEYVKASGLGNSRRIMNLLLVLPLLAQEKVLTRQYWQSVKKEGKVVMHKLLSEMLDANS